MRVGFLLFLVVIFIPRIAPQNNGYFDKIAVTFKMQQIRRYVSQEEKPEMKAGDNTFVNIELLRSSKPIDQSKVIELDKVPDFLLEKAESVEVRPKNICFVIDISGSMGWSMKGEGIESDTGKTRLDLVKEVCSTVMNEVIKVNDIVSVVAFHRENKVVVTRKYISNLDDREEVINAIKELKPDGTTFMMQGLLAAYTLIKGTKDKERYNNQVLLLTDGQQEPGEGGPGVDLEKAKEHVNEVVKKNKEEGIGTNVSTVSFSKDADTAHMNKVAELGGGSSLFIENERNLPSKARLASLVIERDQLQNQINTAWENAEFNVTLVLSDGVSLENADPPYNDEHPRIEEDEDKSLMLIYSHIRLLEGKSILLIVSLSEDVVNKKSTIMWLSVTSSDKGLRENYPLSLNNPVTVTRGENNFDTLLAIKEYN
ncbi:MAG: VWA domain-containing protein [Treponema sp.]|jgi:Mg-chelatase subunit ChlD|nr:VWA domain-containing protein [Treponema sp.]